MASLIWTHKLERVPSVIPARRPALDKSWQGLPPAMMSTGSTVDQSIVVMSPRFGASGNRWASTLHAPLSISDTHAVRAPNTSSTARSSIPAPENRLPAVSTSPPPARVGDSMVIDGSVMTSPHPRRPRRSGW